MFAVLKGGLNAAPDASMESGPNNHEQSIPILRSVSFDGRADDDVPLRSIGLRILDGGVDRIHGLDDNSANLIGQFRVLRLAIGQRRMHIDDVICGCGPVLENSIRIVAVAKGR
jgi:hypothetical protein